MLEEVIKAKGQNAPKEIADQLILIEVPFINFEGKSKTGKLVVNKDLAGEIKEIFRQAKSLDFPIEKMNPFGDKDRATTTNNTSSFNYRPISGTEKMSEHSYGRAIDINPLLNPYYGRKGVSPKGASYDRTKPGTLTADSKIVQLFEARGWEWLGRQKEYPDYMHFEKPA
ncbi:MAG TPA: M15 family metallopeptidase [Candidatus Saccharimonadales bacterium]|nr:M15 family metallopeptidase [Candidatus Saccharimonadales bacterium]